jgi:arylsulfatase A-like enzyme
MAGPQRRTNVVVVVLDCVRRSDFLGGPEAPRLPFCESLAKESVHFPRAISPSPWTIPSHAALFTGVSPWELRCHWRADLHLKPEIPRLSARLGALGYRTMSLSANPLLEPSFGLVEGFDRVAWAGWWEPYLRYGSARPPHVLPRAGPRATGAADALRRKKPVDRALKESRSLLVRHPFLLEGGSRAVQTLRGESESGRRSMARWIEPTFQRWVTETDADQPIFAFINLLDAHEPYFLGDGSTERLAPWWRYARTRQDAWMAWQWRPSQTTLGLLHGLYRQMISEMDARIAQLVRTLQAAGRWDDTMLILTSDHGQEFGEHGVLFHMLRVDEQLLRIPLWMRLPRGEHGGSVAKGWASLVDVAPTVLSRAAGSPDGALLDLLDRERSEPAVAISDGIVWEHIRAKVDPRRMAEADRVFAAAYRGDRKVVVDPAAGRTWAYDVERDPAEGHDVWPAEQGELADLAGRAHEAAEEVAKASRAGLTDEVQSRLESWGYL